MDSVKKTFASALSSPEAEIQIRSASEALNLIFANSNGKSAGLFTHLHSVTDKEDEFKGLLALLGTGLVTETQLTAAIDKHKDPQTQSLIVKTWVNSIKPPSKEDCVKVMNAFAEKDIELVGEVMLSRKDYFPYNDLAKFIVDNAGKGITMKLISFFSKDMEKLKDREQ